MNPKGGKHETAFFCNFKVAPIGRWVHRVADGEDLMLGDLHQHGFQLVSVMVQMGMGINEHVFSNRPGNYPVPQKAPCVSAGMNVPGSLQGGRT